MDSVPSNLVLKTLTQGLPKVSTHSWLRKEVHDKDINDSNQFLNESSSTRELKASSDIAKSLRKFKSDSNLLNIVKTFDDSDIKTDHQNINCTKNNNIIEPKISKTNRCNLI